MSYGKKWKVPVAELESLIANADTNGKCYIEVWSEGSSDIADSELYFLLSSGWNNTFPSDIPDDPDE